MYNEGTVSSLAHVVSIYKFSPHIFKLWGVTVDAAARIFTPSSGNVVEKG